jgi:glycosyltransferase involved in cell wall biosynthesis
LAHIQRKALEARALRGDGAEPLLHFLALCGDWDALAEWALRVNDAERLLGDALTLARNPAAAEALLPRLSGETAHEVLLIAARALLTAGRFDQVGHVIACAMERGDPDPTVLNLAAQAVLARGDRAMANELVQVSLQLNPYQDDIAALPDTPPHRALPPTALAHGPIGSVALYVPAYNAAEYLDRTLPALLEQAYPLSEVILVDDGSTDDTATLACAAGLRVVRHPGNQGLAAGRNTALAQLETDFIAAADADVVLDPMFVWWAMHEFAVGQPNLAGVGGRLIETHTDTPADLWRSLHCGQDPGDLRRYPARLFGADTVYRKKALDAVGGYDVRFRTNGEDHDLCRRLEAQGYRHSVSRFARSWHLRRDTESSVLRMLWQWSYWERVGFDEFASVNALFRGMANWFHQGSKLIEADINSHKSTLTNINFAAPFVWIMRDLEYAADIRLLEPGQAAAVAVALTQPLALSSTPRARRTLEMLQSPMRTAPPAALPEPLAAAAMALEAEARDFVARHADSVLA